ncbi:MAG: MFS transporter, partial [bacterium]|nr:MFS transporter [bacterium]
WNFWSLTLFRFITGIGLGGEWGLGMALFNEAWNKRRGLGSAIIQSCIPVGSLLAGLIGGTIIAAQGPDGWRWALASGFVPVVVCIAIRFAMPESKLWQEYDQMRRAGELPESRGTFAELRELTQAGMRKPLLLGFMLVGGYMLAYYGVTTFMPTMIVHNYHQHVPVWKDVNTYAVWIVIPIKIAFGAFGDRLGRKFAALGPIVFMLVASVGYLAISTSGFRQPYAGSIWQWNVFWIFFIWSAGNASTSSIGAWLSETFPTKVRATGISTAYMLGRGLGGFSPILVPLIAAGNWALGMGVISIVGSLAFIVAAVLLPETRNRVLRAGETVGETAVRTPAAPAVKAT